MLVRACAPGNVCVSCSRVLNPSLWVESREGLLPSPDAQHCLSRRWKKALVKPGFVRGEFKGMTTCMFQQHRPCRNRRCQAIKTTAFLLLRPGHRKRQTFVAAWRMACANNNSRPHIVRHTSFPFQVLVDAVINSGPREDSTRVGSAGVVRRQAVDLAPFRRVNQVCSRSLYRERDGVGGCFTCLIVAD